ncbi:hypothetical protein DL96DRAFT_1503584 [Flagelloscypha sp. PMI_526]|nr:hypothetical protein DL96DRAFT_1503584 [Flagelloscypha sp. PMI_526]
MAKLEAENKLSVQLSISPMVLPHHPVWYTENVTTFQVEDTLFRVPNRRLAESSPQFRDMVGRENEGHSDDNPVVLDDSKADFCSLLKFLDPQKDGQPSTGDEWLGVPKLSQKYGFPGSAVDQAADNLINHGEVSSAQLYELGQTFNVRIFTEMAIMRFCNAKSALIPTDGQQIGLPLALAIAAVREQLLSSHIPFERHLSNISSSDREDILKMDRNVEAGRNILDGCPPNHKTIPSGAISAVTSYDSVITSTPSSGIGTGSLNPSITSGGMTATIPVQGLTPAHLSSTTNSAVPSGGMDPVVPSRTMAPVVPSRRLASVVPSRRLAPVIPSRQIAHIEPSSLKAAMKYAAERLGDGVTPSRPPGVNPPSSVKKRQHTSSSMNDHTPTASKKRKTAVSSSVEDVDMKRVQRLFGGV